MVAECGGRVVGYSVGVIEEGSKGHLISIAVEEAYRGRGLGRSLIKEFEVRVKSLGVTEVVLEVSVSNSVAVSLYKKLNYKVIRVLKNYYPDGEDAYLMLKELE